MLLRVRMQQFLKILFDVSVDSLEMNSTFNDINPILSRHYGIAYSLASELAHKQALHACRALCRASLITRQKNVFATMHSCFRFFSLISCTSFRIRVIDV